MTATRHWVTNSPRCPSDYGAVPDPHSIPVTRLSGRSTQQVFLPADATSSQELATLIAGEHARAEALVNRIRCGVVVLLGATAVAYAPRIPHALVRLNMAVLLPVLGWTLWQGWRLRRADGYSPQLAWLNPAIDVTALTVLQAGYGVFGSPGLAIHAPIFLAYFAVLASRSLTGSARAAAATTVLTTLCYATLSATFLLSGRLEVVSSPLDVGSIDSASLLDEVTKVLLLLTVGAIATYATAWHDGILHRALGAQVRRAAEERELAKRLQEADKLSAIGTIAAAAVHEVRNPLTTINLQAQLLLRTKLDTEQREDVERVFSEARRANAFVEDLLRVTRASVADNDAGPVSLPVVVQAALTAASPLLRDQYVTATTSVDTPDDEMPCLVGSAAGLERAVLNLVVNAVQAMEGQTEEKTLSLAVSGGRANGSLALVVADNGPGFTTESGARAFERFFTTKPPGKGTGLGLWIVRETVTAFGGSVTVDPGTDRGAQIRLTFPLPGSARSSSGDARRANRLATPNGAVRVTAGS
jgi:signal transduction histidine kinase